MAPCRRPGTCRRQRELDRSRSWSRALTTLSPGHAGQGGVRRQPSAETASPCGAVENEQPSSLTVVESESDLPDLLGVSHISIRSLARM